MLAPALDDDLRSGPLAALLSLAAVQSSAFAAWSLILRKGYGRKPRDRLLGAKPPASDTELSPMPADGGTALEGAPRGWALRPPRWLRRVADEGRKEGIVVAIGAPSIGPR